MIITFTPAEGEKRVWEFTKSTLMSVEAEVVEEKSGRTFDETIEAAFKGSARARRAIVYVLEKRTHPTLAWAAFDYPVDAVEIQFDRDELGRLREQVEKRPGLSDAERAEAIEALSQAEAELPEVPKAPAVTSDSDA